MQLDLLRGVAILLVLFTHIELDPSGRGVVGATLSYLRNLGPTGVDLFFVLSGFLVGGLLFKELRGTGQLDVRRFLIRRGFKIWPSYFVFVAFMFLVQAIGHHAGVVGGLRSVLPNLLHLQNYLGSPREHTWSLAVEEHFYLALPLLLLLLLRRRHPDASRPLSVLPYIALALSVVCALLRLHAYANPTSYNPHFATHLRIDSLFFGVLLGYLYHFEPERLTFVERRTVLVLCVGLLMLVAYPASMQLHLGHLLRGSLGFAWLYVAYGCVLLAMLHLPLGRGWLGRRLAGPTARGVARIGFYSYPIYLWHIDATRPVTMLLRRGALESWPIDVRWLVAFAAYVALAFVGGAIVGKLVDLPSLALRERLFPPRARPTSYVVADDDVAAPIFP
jgi:peptidoglycan/LPS O-acetylase OafA/YrhL